VRHAITGEVWLAGQMRAKMRPLAIDPAHSRPLQLGCHRGPMGPGRA
jgi:hypothetical protein